MQLASKLLCIALACLLCFSTPLQGAEPDVRPNILVIVADDLGYTDIGAFGGEISTPNLDSLANEGTRLTNFHVLPSCAPTRAVLLTGVDNHAAGLGSQLPTEKQRGIPGYEGYLSEDVTTMPEVLAAAGYRTYFSGKWHLGNEDSQSAYSRGFQNSFALLPGGGSHFADATALRPGEPMAYRSNGQLLDKLPDDFYSSKFYTDTLLSWLKRDLNEATPFFAYLAYTAPHDPLHAPASYIKKYQGTYDQGYENLRASRIKGLQQQGLLSPEYASPPWPGVVPRWQDLTPEQQKLKSRDMEVYAGMVDYMDEQIGRVLNWLEENNQLDNTFIIFFSDNGANPYAATAYPGHDQEYHAQFDNSLENRGHQGSFVGTGAGWATASSSIYRFFKAFSTEGGIRTPAILSPPKAYRTSQVSNVFTHVSDFMPTFLELAGASLPHDTTSDAPMLTGQSLLPILTSQTGGITSNRGIGYEVNGTRAYIQGDWKILQMPVPMGTGDWELFNLQNDPSESENLASTRRDKLEELVALHEQYELEAGVVFDLPGPLGRLNIAFQVLTGLILAMCSWSVFRQLRREKDGHETRARRVVRLCIASLIVGGAIMLLVGPYYRFGAGLLSLIAIMELGNNLYRRASMVSSIVPILTMLALYLFWFFKSGQSIALLLG